MYFLSNNSNTLRLYLSERGAEIRVNKKIIFSNKENAELIIALIKHQSFKDVSRLEAKNVELVKQLIKKIRVMDSYGIPKELWGEQWMRLLKDTSIFSQTNKKVLP